MLVVIFSTSFCIEKVDWSYVPGPGAIVPEPPHLHDTSTRLSFNHLTKGGGKGGGLRSEAKLIGPICGCERWRGIGRFDLRAQASKLCPCLKQPAPFNEASEACYNLTKMSYRQDTI